MGVVNAAEFHAKLAEFDKAGQRHNRELLKFLAASRHGEPYLARELARQGVSRAEFERSLTIEVTAKAAPTR